MTWQVLTLTDGPDWARADEAFMHPIWRRFAGPRNEPDYAAARVWFALTLHGPMTVGQLARATGLSKPALSQARAGKALPILQRLEALGLATTDST
jgi:Bacterial regulatory protein, arsR family